MIVGPMIYARTGHVDDSQLDTLVAAALDAVETRLSAGEDCDSVVVDVVGTLFGPLGTSADEVARIAGKLLRLLPGSGR